jgi:SagB-type dehydrogenase family enzyme
MAIFRPGLAVVAAFSLQAAEPIKLPPPEPSAVTLTDALKARKTDRVLIPPSVSLQEASQLLWAAQGENRPGRRTAPSIYAKYSLELYLVTIGSPTLPEGVYHYLSAGHQLERVEDGGPKQLLGKVKGMFSLISNAPAVIVMAGDSGRVESAAFGKGIQYSWYEAGAASENLLLMAAALKLGVATQTPYSVDMEEVGRILGMKKPVRPFSLLLLGRIGPPPAN